MLKCHKCQVELTATNAMGSEKVLYDIDICRKCFGYPAYSESGIKCEGPRFNWDPRGALDERAKMAAKANLPAEGRSPSDGQPA